MVCNIVTKVDIPAYMFINRQN